MEYKLVVRHESNHNPEYVVLGLADPGDTVFGIEPKPDTKLMVGLHHSCDTPQSVMDSVYRSLYDHHQCVEALQDGDIIASDATRYPVHGAYDAMWGYVDVPPMRFRVQSYHVIREAP